MVFLSEEFLFLELLDFPNTVLGVIDGIAFSVRNGLASLMFGSFIVGALPFWLLFFALWRLRCVALRWAWCSRLGGVLQT